jgi:DNA-binding PadR family transcriptional regulator
MGRAAGCEGDSKVRRPRASGKGNVGYAVLGWLRRVTDGELQIEDAALYPALHRMEARGVIEAEWGTRTRQ